MVQARFGSRRVVAALALVAIAAIGMTGAAWAQGQEEQAEHELRARLERAERALAEALARAESALAQKEEVMERALAETERVLADRQRGMEREMVAARRAQEEARARFERVMPHLRGRVPMVTWRGWSSGAGLAERVLSHAEELELTDAQADQVRAAHRAHRRDQIEREASIEVAELDLEEMMRDAGSADLAAVESQMMEIARLRVQDRVADLELRQEIDGVLTAAQREQLDDLGPRMFLRSRGDAPGGLFRHDGPGAFLFRDGEDGAYTFRFDEGWDFGADHWFDGSRLFESLAPLHELWFERLHEDAAAPEDDDRDGDQGATSGTSVGAGGVKTEASI